MPNMIRNPVVALVTLAAALLSYDHAFASENTDDSKRACAEWRPWISAGESTDMFR